MALFAATRAASSASAETPCESPCSDAPNSSAGIDGGVQVWPRFDDVNATGLLWLDHHVHKNGGTSVRDMMRSAASEGGCVYWGYWLGLGWEEALDLLREPANYGARLCLEEHFPAEEPTSVLERHAQLQDLKHSMNDSSKPGRALRVLQTTRVREPLAYYISYFKWVIAGPQLANAPGFNKTFLEWSVPNLQCNLFLHPRRSGALESGQYKIGAEDDEFSTFNETDLADLEAMLDDYDLVATTERFAHFAAVASRLTGLPVRYRHRVPEQRGLPPDAHPLSDEEVCPDMDACREHVERLATLDRQLYERYSAKFDEKVAAEGVWLNAEAEALREADELQANAQADSDGGWVGGQPAQPSLCGWAEAGSAPQPAEAEGACAAAPSSVTDIVAMDMFGSERRWGALGPDGVAPLWANATFLGRAPRDEDEVEGGDAEGVLRWRLPGESGPPHAWFSALRE